MPEERLDRRVLRTRAALRDALFSLIEEKGYGDITIQDITDRANVNRVTFYFHYKDKEDLLFKVLQDLYEQLEAELKTIEGIEEWARQDLLLAFRHIQQHARLYRILLLEKGSPSFMGRLIDYMAEAALKAESARLPANSKPRLPLPMIEYYWAGAFIGLVRWWILNDMPYSAEEMTEMCYQLETNNSAWALGLDTV